MSELQKKIGSSYDQLPYHSVAFAQSAPEHLHAVAHLFGIQAPDPETARVLELGCAAGGNLLPFAVRNPRAQAVGVDLSEVQIENGKALIADLALGNIELRCMSITEIDASLGRFDYIVCHGVYSWVPEEVQNAILRICKQNLSENGVAYVSYNTYPGWKAKEVIRDAMILRGGARDSAPEKLGYARGMIDFLHEHARPGSVLKQTLDENIATIRNGPEYYLHHEFLELCNSPCYFREFAGRAKAQGLSYLAESTVVDMFASNYGQNAAGPLLRECQDQESLEQMLDFLNNRVFRQTLLMHAGRQAKYTLDDPRLMDMHVAGAFAPDPDNGDSAYRAKYGNQRFQARNRIAHEVVRRLNEAWPSTVPARSLAKAVAADTACKPGEIVSVLEFLLISGAVRFRLAPLKLRRRGGVRPFVNASVRALALHRAKASTQVSLFNQWHEFIADPGPVDLAVLELADGERSRDDLIDLVRQRNRDGQIRFFVDGAELTDADKRDSAAAEHVDAAIKRLREQAMLE